MKDAQQVKAIFKFPMPKRAGVPIQMPVGAQALSVQIQRGELVLWAIVDAAADAATEPRTFDVFMTGEPLPARVGRFVATVQSPDGWLVFHVFEGPDTDA
jgi:hypothetical protein